MDWKLSLAGLLIGLLVGFTGMGGGSLMTPLLVLFFGFKPSIAIGTDIVHGAIFKSFGAAQHRRLGHVHARLTAWMLLGSAPFPRVACNAPWMSVVVEADGAVRPCFFHRPVGSLREATLVSIVEFDRYTGKGVPAEQVSLSLRLTFRAPDRTLTDDEVQQAMAQIVSALKTSHGAEQR